MRQRSILLLVLVLLYTGLLMANTPDVALNQSQTSGYLLNPAYVGQHEYTFASVQMRTQWVGMPGAPQQQYLFVEHSLVPRTVGLGLALYNQQSGAIANTGGYVTYRYSFRLSQQQRLSPALSMGLMQNRIDFDRIIAENLADPGIVAGIGRQTRLDANLGLLYQYADQWEVALASYQLLANTYKYEDYTHDTRTAYNTVRSFVLSARYNHVFAQEWELSSLLYLYSQQGVQVQPSVRVVGSYLPYGASIAVGYTLDQAVAVGASLWLYDKLNIGYAAEFGSSAVRQYTGLTQQLSLGLRIGQSAAARPGRVTTRDIDELRRLNQETYEYIERVAQHNDQQQRYAQAHRLRVDSLEHEIAYLRAMALEAQTVIRTLPGEAITIDTTYTPATYVASTPDTLPTEVYYVVLGYYTQLSYARRYQQLLSSQLGIDTDIYTDQNKAYYVYTRQLHSMSQVQQEFARVKQYQGLQRYMEGNVWALKRNAR